MRTTIRLATVADGDAIARIYRPAVIDSATSFEIVAPQGKEMGVRVERTLQRTPWLVCENGNDVVGYAYANTHHERPAYQWSVDTTVYVREDQHRTGVGRALYMSLFAILVRQGFYSAYAGITLPNEASIGLHTSIGFTPVGVYRGVGFKHGAWRDIAWLERELAPRNRMPNHPVSLPTLLKTVELEPSLAVGLQFLQALMR
ncbi:MAG: N-acetyltransferase family protein [Gemmatimonadaceae bacterium]